MRTITPIRNPLLVAVLGATLLAPAAASLAAGNQPPVEVTTCGQVLDGDGFLSADLDCSGFDDTVVISPKDGDVRGVAVVLRQNNSTLELRGHTLTAGTRRGVWCVKGCEIIGEGGSILGLAGNSGVYSGRSLKIEGVTVSLFADHGLQVRRRAKVLDSVISDNVEHGIRADGGALIRNSSIIDNGERGISTGRAVRIYDSTVAGNQHHGIQAGKILVKDATVTGNGVFGVCPNCGGTCVDLHAEKKPRLLGTSTCDKSRDPNGSCARDWGICLND